jgi:FkbM family methyltransferase
MEINRKYEYDPEFVPLLCKWLYLGPKPSSVIVDVGCGSGYFTKIIARCVKEKGKVVGIDPDRKLVQEAEKICERKHISNTRLLACMLCGIFVSFDYGSDLNRFEILHTRTRHQKRTFVS